jgi:hypothetical protein
MKRTLAITFSLSIAGLLQGCSEPFPEGNFFDTVIVHRILSVPDGISFSDTNDRPRYVNGTITVSAAPDGSTVGRYNLYWSAGDRQISLIASFPAGAGSFSYTFPAATAIPAGATHFLAASVDVYVGQITPFRSIPIGDRKVFYIFIASPALTDGNIDGLTTWNGHALSTYGTVNLNNGDPMEEADAICQAAAENGNISSAGTVPTVDPSVPATYNQWKAMLVDGINRRSPVAGGIDWVFRSRQLYRRVEDGATVDTTNSAGVFSFPLTAGFTSANTESYWTGLTQTWGTNSDLCVNSGRPWNSGLAGAGSIGDLAIATAFNTTPPDANAINESSVPCNNPGNFLVCVEQ